MSKRVLTSEETQQGVLRLAKAAAGLNWCPGGGWQFPFDFGNGVVAPTYTPVQAMHPWRRDVMLSAIEKLIPAEERAATSVLDLGAGEGAMALGLWNAGFRDITLVETRPVNIEKAQFVANHFGAEFKFQSTTVESFLNDCTRQYQITLFMGLLYHLLNPFEILNRIGAVTSRLMVLETALALPRLDGFDNRPDYAPSEAAFYVRIDTAESQTAGLNNFELWPNKAAVELLTRNAGFGKIEWLDGRNPPPDFANHTRLIALAEK